jgi:hypothetical protein
MIGLPLIRIHALSTTLLLLIGSNTGRSAPWPAWRGPTHDGISPGNKRPPALEPIAKCPLGSPAA